MIEKIILKSQYKRYQEEKINIVFRIDPDHIADCMFRGEKRKIKFRSGKFYTAKFIHAIPDGHDLLIGEYEMSKETQELSFKEFCSIARGTGFNFRRA